MDMNNELQHHGTKGMKWGVRRYQNKDGSLTALGRKRAGQTSVGSSKKKAKKEKIKVEKPKKKSVSEMSDDELNKAITRARNEDTYRALRPEKTPAGKRFFKSLASNVIAPAATAAGKRFLENALNKVGDKLLEDAVDPDSYEALKKEFDKLELKTKIDKMNNPDKYMSWEEHRKRQDYRKNQRDWFNEDMDGNPLNNDKSSSDDSNDTGSSGGNTKTGKKGTKWEKRSQSEQTSDDSGEDLFGKIMRERQKATENTRLSDKQSYGPGDYDIIDPEPSNRSSGSSGSSKKKTTITLNDDQWQDITDNYSDSGRSHVSGYLSAPASSASTRAISDGRSYIAGLLGSGDDR